MKCPKCQYLGFDTGTRCRNCGYDFSLLALAAADDVGDLRLRPDDSPHVDPDDPPESSSPQIRLEDLPLALELAGVSSAVAETTLPPRTVQPPGRRPRATQDTELREEDDRLAAAAEPHVAELPLFSDPDDVDAPLVRVASSPRPPIAVRKAPEVPRVARPPAAVRRDARPAVKAEPFERGSDEPRRLADSPLRQAQGDERVATPCTASQRAIAAAIDAAVLGGLHLIVLYFTIRMAGLTVADWRLLPPVPLAGFLGALTVTYVAVFTAVGGQTIGKMATSIRVVSDDGLMTVTQAVARAFAALGSIAVLGAGLVPAFFGERRALHDRLARTRVVAVRPGA